MSKPKYDPKGNFYALRRIRRTAACIQGSPAKAVGEAYVDPPTAFNSNGRPINPTIFTMADRTPEQVEKLVDDLRVIAPLPNETSQKS